MLHLRIEGVYDYRTMSFLLEQGVHHVLFDLRPLSANFIQEYRLVEILKDFSKDFIKIGLYFREEKDFIIERIYNSAKEAIDHSNKLYIELDHDKLVYPDINCAFTWRLRESIPPEVVKHPKWEGLIIKASDPNLENYRENYGNKQLGISVDPNSSDSVPDFATYATVNIDRSMEVCYRNVDLLTLRDEITQLRTLT